MEKPPEEAPAESKSLEHESSAAPAPAGHTNGQEVDNQAEAEVDDQTDPRIAGQTAHSASGQAESYILDKVPENIGHRTSGQADHRGSEQIDQTSFQQNDGQASDQTGNLDNEAAEDLVPYLTNQRSSEPRWPNLTERRTSEQTDRRLSSHAERRSSQQTEHRLSNQAERTSEQIDRRLSGQPERRTSQPTDRRQSGSTDRRTSQPIDRRLSTPSERRTSQQIERRLSSQAERRASQQIEERLSVLAERRASQQTDHRLSSLADQGTSEQTDHILSDRFDHRASLKTNQQLYDQAPELAKPQANGSAAPYTMDKTDYHADYKEDLSYHGTLDQSEDRLFPQFGPIREDQEAGYRIQPCKFEDSQTELGPKLSGALETETEGTAIFQTYNLVDAKFTSNFQAKDQASAPRFPSISHKVDCIPSQEKVQAVETNPNDTSASGSEQEKNSQTYSQTYKRRFPPIVYEDPYQVSLRYMEKHHIMQIFQITESLVYEKPEDPLNFMLSQVQNMMKNRDKM
ncbi:uncharacterized protein C3orf30 homolog isoform X2 [Tupaia chinensis]|uniref:uncharacterized protein C3orf30 homolog isoform X2 n=1 Tax=Tupaia chinensis TaxID=246437 RepID=UPI000FFBF2DC|nr:uncharacterized protein C3orf30 homolog isoform X2 [Tupaia chinensis]